MSGAEPVHIALVDDHTLVHDGFALRLENMEGYVLSMLAVNGQDLIARFGAAKPPDIAIVDMHMPVMGGAETIQWIRAHWPDTHVLGLSFDRTIGIMKEATRAGACGFIPKDISTMEFRDALSSVIQQGYYHHAALIREHLATGEVPLEVDLLTDLTPTEKQVLDCVCTADEPTWEQVADRMGKCGPTIDTHRAALFKKLHVKSKPGLVNYGCTHGFGKGRFWAKDQGPPATS